jgi:transposase InsO family protein
MHRKIPLPRSWNRRVKSAVLQILALSHYSFTILLARAANDRKRRTRSQGEIDRLQQALALLQEELRIKDARMGRLHPHRRPFYTPFERMAILEMRAARGWSAQQTADRFFLTLTTVGAWMARIDEEGPNALLQLREPVNKFPDLVRYLVQRLKVMCPRLGKAKIAEMLCRAGLHLAPTTVGRMLREDPIVREPIAAAVAATVRADRPNHVWHIDLSAVPTRFGFWVPWPPAALPQAWPFCWWVVVVLDHFSRRVQGFQVCDQKPDAQALCAFLGRTIAKVGAAPRHLISDQESMFTSDGFRAWCRRRGIRLRYGAVGKHGSIAIVERFIRSMKHECTRRIQVPLRRDRLRGELAFYIAWYNNQRPHGALGVRTPDEVYGGLPPACEDPRLELRARWPAASRCASPQAPMERDGPDDIRLEVTFLGGRRHLPIVSLRRAA